MSTQKWFKSIENIDRFGLKFPNVILRVLGVLVSDVLTEARVASASDLGRSNKGLACGHLGLGDENRAKDGVVEGQRLNLGSESLSLYYSVKDRQVC